MLTLHYLVQQLYGTYKHVPGSQQQNELTQFPVCVNVGVFSGSEILPQAGERHMLTRFSL